MCDCSCPTRRSHSEAKDQDCVVRSTLANFFSSKGYSKQHSASAFQKSLAIGRIDSDTTVFMHLLYFCSGMGKQFQGGKTSEVKLKSACHLTSFLDLVSFKSLLL
jgi:hypothetical protein